MPTVFLKAQPKEAHKKITISRSKPNTELTSPPQKKPGSSWEMTAREALRVNYLDSEK